MSIKRTALYQEMRRRLPDVPAGPRRLLGEFESLRTILQEHGKYIVLLFPEYTPHDHTRHLDHLFALADRVLGTALYQRLNPSELVLLAFGLYAHDWGMAVSEAEQKSLENGTGGDSFAMLPDEPLRAQELISEATLSGTSPEVAWRDYLRQTHGLRSGARLREYLQPLGAVFADAVARIAEGHTLDVREVRDVERYPLATSVFGETVNLASLTTYVRMVDLLDIGEDRTPYALWKFVAPADPFSKMEWQKHRALSPVAVKDGSVREIMVNGVTDDPAVFAALADLRSWIDGQFAMSIAQLRTISGKYDLDLDSRILWSIDAVGFEPLTVRFEMDRSEVLGLLSSELYQDDPLAFLRELLQNSVDAIDIREALLAKHRLMLNGEIQVRTSAGPSGLCIEWGDNGIGMDSEVLSSYFARLGLSWYRSREANRIGQIEAISQFGVGILSCFAVTDKLMVETRKDPQAGGSPPSLSIEIPKRESHFRIRTATSLPVGTTIRLEVRPSLTGVVSGEAVRHALARIARFVRHRIVADFDGVATEIRPLARSDAWGAEDAGSDNLKIAVVGMDGDSAENISALTTTIVFQVGSLGGDYHGHYSAIIPKRPTEVMRHAHGRVWFLEGKRIDLDQVLIETERALFVKGIQTGPVGVWSRHREEAEFGLGRHTEWINPKVLLNVRHPSFVKFNLARSSARLESRDWLDEAWRDIARKLRANAFTWPLVSAADTAIMLGSCAVFGGVPDRGLDALVEENEIPLLVLRSGEGLVWSVLRDFAHGEEFVEAPFELNYADSGELRGFGTRSELAGWEGGDALFPTELLTSNRYPWLAAVLAFGARALTRLGWCPVEIRTVQPPANEVIALVCRVWKKCGADYYEGDRRHGTPKEKRRAPANWRRLNNLYADAPQLLRFPPSIAEHAAIGSRYWNIDHPKITRIVAALTSLAERLQQKRLSADQLKLVSYLRSNAFYGYLVPSRKSGIRLALEVPNRLLAVAEKEGLAHAEYLVPTDFVPGTVEGYENPYHYDLSGWNTRGTRIGQPLDERTEESP